MTERYDLEELKTRLDIVEVARLCGLDPKKSGSSWVARCPAHPDGSEGRPNLAIHPTKGAKCFRCGFQADVIGLAVKARGETFGEVVDWLARLAGLSPQGEGKPAKGSKSGSGLGYKVKGQGPAMYPKGEPLPPAPPVVVAPWPAVRIIGDPPPDPGLVSPPLSAVAQEDRLPWAGFDTFEDLEAATGRAYVALVETTRRLGLDVDDPSTSTHDQVAPLLDEYRRLDSAWAVALGLAGEGTAQTDRPTLRVRVFEAFLAYTTPVGEVDPPRAADWLRDKKGLSVETQEAAGLRWLTDWAAADKGLKAAFDGETLKTFGLVTDKGRLHFERHRLLFPFWVKGKPVFLQARNIDAQGDDRRFDNPSGSVPCPYNVDALGEAHRTGRPVFICEGPTDTLNLTQSGRLAVGIIGTQGLKADWVARFEGLEVFLAFDGDKPGREAAQKVADLFVAQGLTAPKIVPLPDGQDVTDFFTGKTSKKKG